MTAIIFTRLTEENFGAHSLDGFIRHQEVREIWRKTADGCRLVPNAFTEDWDLEHRREVAREICDGIRDGGFAFGAFSQNKAVGFALVSGKAFGSSNQYVQLQLFHVSEPFRCQGIGRKLFGMACAEARSIGAKKIYISAHSSKESQAAYRRMGCVDAEEINQELARAEPFDIQMEYML